MAGADTLMKMMATYKLIGDQKENLKKGKDKVAGALGMGGATARADRLRGKIKKKADDKKRKEDKIAATARDEAFLRMHSDGWQSVMDSIRGFEQGATEAEETAATDTNDKMVSDAEKSQKKRPKTGGRQKGTKNKAKMDSADEGSPTATEGEDSPLSSVVTTSGLSVTSPAIEELLEIERAELAIDERREDREIKADRRALEDRRDKKGGGMLAMAGKPTMNKKAGAGFLSTIGQSLLSLGKKFLIPIATTAASLFGLKKFLKAADNADDLAKIATKIDDVAKGTKGLAQAGSKMHLADDALKGVAKTSQLINHTDDIAKVGTKVDDGLKGVAKTSQLVNYTDDIARVGTKVDDGLKGVAKTSQLINYADDIAKVGTKIDDGLKAGVKATNLVNYTDDIARVGTKIDDGLKAGVKATNLINYTDDIAKVGTKIDDGLKAGVKATNLVNYAGKFTVLGGKIDKMDSVVQGISKTVSGSASALKALSASDEAAKLLKSSSQVVDSIPGGSVSKVIATGADATADAARIAAKNADDLAKGLTVAGKTSGKLLSRFSKMLAPLDIVNKMGQGQGFFESIANMGVELGAMAVGGLDAVAEYQQKGLAYASGGFMTDSGNGLLGNKDSEGFIGEGKWGDKSRALETGDALGNKDKWQTSYLEQGINKAVSGITGTEQTANAKVYTEEQKKLAFAAEDTGAVDIGFGQGDIDDLEALTLLDPKSLQALLAYEVFSDKDQKMIESIMNAKNSGQSVKYNDNGWFGKEGVDFGPASPTSNLDEVQGETNYVKDFDKITADKKLQDDTAEAMLNEGSIYTHDTHLEKIFNGEGDKDSIFNGKKGISYTVQRVTSPSMKPGAPGEAKDLKGADTSINAQQLESALVTEGMRGDKNANRAASQMTNVVNQPNNSVTNTNVHQAGSTAHAPQTPAGIGHMGVGSRG